MTPITLPWPPKALSPNARVHWAVRSKATRSYFQAAYYHAKAARWALEHDGPVRLCITFHPPDKRHRDDDNLIASFKAARDGIALALEMNDRHFVTVATIGEPVKCGAVVVSINQGGE